MWISGIFQTIWDDTSHEQPPERIMLAGSRHEASRKRRSQNGCVVNLSLTKEQASKIRAKVWHVLLDFNWFHVMIMLQLARHDHAKLSCQGYPLHKTTWSVKIFIKTSQLKTHQSQLTFGAQSFAIQWGYHFHENLFQKGSPTKTPTQTTNYPLVEKRASQKLELL